MIYVKEYFKAFYKILGLVSIAYLALGVFLLGDDGALYFVFVALLGSVGGPLAVLLEKGDKT